MNDNRETLDHLFSIGGIDIRRGSLLDTPPEPAGRIAWDRLNGMMLGLAIGDALGRTSEPLLPAERFARHGEIRDYLPNRNADDRRVGTPSDDTQLAFWTLEQMIADRGFVPERVAHCFTQRHIFGVGGTVKAFLRNYKAGVRPWYRCGVKSAGNGALMRIAPMVIPHAFTATSELWVDTALSAMITHNDSASISACVAFVGQLWQLLQAEETPGPEWWLESYVNIARQLEQDDTYAPRGGDYMDYRGTLWGFVDRYVGPAYHSGRSVVEACNSWYSAAFLLETVPCVLLTLMRHGDDPEEAIVRAVNDTKDNDTVAAIVGAAVGALHGAAALPARWVENLTGQVDGGDDGRIFDLLDQAAELWCPQAAP
jgi:ADP-ribosyl-[dinitrogen reductase] hydrolase